jgi:hypothetical protein
MRKRETGCAEPLVALLDHAARPTLAHHAQAAANAVRIVVRDATLNLP